MLEIETNIAMKVKELSYAKNHHWLRLKDKSGHETTLIEQSVIEHRCETCDFVFWAKTNVSAVCPSCLAPGLEGRWLKPQIALIPEEESDFTMPEE